VAACAIDPVPTPGVGDGADNQLGGPDAHGPPDARPASNEATSGVGCACFDDQGQRWECEPGADACPCEPATLVCPDGALPCEGLEVPEVVEPGELVEP
jgi:hypothetical protein